MNEHTLPIRDLVWARLQSLTMEKHRETNQLVEEALLRYLDHEEHLDAMFLAYRGREIAGSFNCLAAE
ncbi:MAG: hypothetical protein P4M00_19715 [Azospirillaceae bacterium]|nr:hypothetical protein [Azospirillaceae bacterium]